MQLKDVATKAILYGSIDLGAGKKSYSDYDLNDYKEKRTMEAIISLFSYLKAMSSK